MGRSVQLQPQPQLLHLQSDQLLDRFGAGRASPGSGSASALLALLAAKMELTVCEISLSKQATKANWSDFEFIRREVSEVIEPELRELFEKDARDFEMVVKLRRQRNSARTRNEKSSKQREALDLLETANGYALQIAGKGLRLMEFGVLLFETGWHAIKGDSGVAISSSMAAVMSCIFVINLNIKTLHRRNYAAEAKKSLDAVEARLRALQDRAFSCITQSGTDALEALELELPID